MKAIANWWNSISLRTKVTGVTVLMLTAGLLISGIGTSALLRNYLVDQVDSRLRSAQADWQGILGPGADPDSETCFGVARSEFSWAIYKEDGSLHCDNWSINNPELRPELDNLNLERTVELAGSIVSIPSSLEGSGWR